MNRWATYLAATPAKLLRLIAASQRISLARTCTLAEVQARLRRALCRAQTVREVYFTLAPEAQAALQELRRIPHGLALPALAARYGSIRPLAELRADRRPQSIAERLLLLGWLLPRPATRNHPLRYLLPRELRAWLPVPISEDVGAVGPSPRPCPPPALRAATAILLACAEAPLPLCGDGRPTAAAVRTLAAWLAPMPLATVAALTGWLLPLLADLALLAPHGAAAAPGPAARRFLQAPPTARLQTLRDAWVRAPRRDPWLRPLRVSSSGLDWPVFRRRLLAWAEALPADQPLSCDHAHALLSAALGPLADAHTHGLRTLRRSPWLPRRATAVWDAAAHGPLIWLGVLTGDAGMLYRPGRPLGFDDATLPAWTLNVPGELGVPHGDAEADQLDLLPFLHGHASDAAGTTYSFSRTSLARAAGRGHDPARLRVLLERRVGLLPEVWSELLAPGPQLRLMARTVLLSDHPATLAGAARSGAVRRKLAVQLAPGVALVEPGREPALVRALERQGLAVSAPTPFASPLPDQSRRLDDLPPARRTPDVPPLMISASETATLLAACAWYRSQAPADAPPGPTDALLDRLRASLSPALAAACAAALAPITPAPSPPPAMASTEPGAPVTIAQLRQAIARRHALIITYAAPEAPAESRCIRPLRLERHGPHWLLHAYCLLRQDERCFRVDRISAASPASMPRRTRVSSMHDPQRPANAKTLRTGFFTAPPTPPDGRPLVRIWLDVGEPPAAAPAPSDEVVRGLGCHAADAVDRDALDSIAIESVAAHAIEVLIDQRADRPGELSQFHGAELALEDAKLHPCAVTLEQLHHLRAPLVVDDVVRDNREHTAPHPAGV